MKNGVFDYSSSCLSMSDLENWWEQSKYISYFCFILSWKHLQHNIQYHSHERLPVILQRLIIIKLIFANRYAFTICWSVTNGIRSNTSVQREVLWFEDVSKMTIILKIFDFNNFLLDIEKLRIKNLISHVCLIDHFCDKYYIIFEIKYISMFLFCIHFYGVM